MMRTPTLGIIPQLAESFSRDMSLEMFRRMCLIRYFELSVISAINCGQINCPVYLSLGQESISSAIATVIPDWLIFAQHRAHSVYLAFGGDVVRLIDELLGRTTGCSGGWGGSVAIQDASIGMIGHHGLIGENIPLAVGAALGNPKQKVICFFGDGAAEEDYVFPSLGFAATHKLPVLFVCEDNDLSILTPTSQRRKWSITRVAEAFGVPAVDITDDPWLIAHHAKELSKNLPAFINCRTCRHHWHVGTGIDGPPEWDRFELVKLQLKFLSLSKSANTVEKESRQFVEELWDEQLRKR